MYIKYDLKWPTQRCVLIMYTASHHMYSWCWLLILHKTINYSLKKQVDVKPTILYHPYSFHFLQNYPTVTSLYSPHEHSQCFRASCSGDCHADFHNYHNYHGANYAYYYNYYYGICYSDCDGWKILTSEKRSLRTLRYIHPSLHLW